MLHPHRNLWCPQDKPCVSGPFPQPEPLPGPTPQLRIWLLLAPAFLSCTVVLRHFSATSLRPRLSPAEGWHLGLLPRGSQEPQGTGSSKLAPEQAGTPGVTAAWWGSLVPDMNEYYLSTGRFQVLPPIVEAWEYIQRNTDHAHAAMCI